MLLVVLMIVKEAGYLPFQRGRLQQIAEGAGAVEELPLQFGGNSIPAHEHGRAQAPQDLLFFIGEVGTIVANPPPSNRLVDMDRHPFFVFGQRRVGLREIAEFTHFTGRTRHIGEESREFGCFRSVLLGGEHLTCLSMAGRHTIGVLPTGRVGASVGSMTHLHGDARAN
jgi:hypothetical protein